MTEMLGIPGIPRSKNCGLRDAFNQPELEDSVGVLVASMNEESVRYYAVPVYTAIDYGTVPELIESMLAEFNTRRPAGTVQNGAYHDFRHNLATLSMSEQISRYTCIATADIGFIVEHVYYEEHNAISPYWVVIRKCGPKADRITDALRKGADKIPGAFYFRIYRTYQGSVDRDPSTVHADDTVTVVTIDYYHGK